MIKDMGISVGRQGEYAYISVVANPLVDRELPWVLGFPVDQIDEVIEKLEQLNKELGGD